jgi:hypothetical protein
MYFIKQPKWTTHENFLNAIQGSGGKRSKHLLRAYHGPERSSFKGCTDTSFIAMAKFMRWMLSLFYR